MITIDNFLKAYCSKSSTDENGCKRSDGLTMGHAGDVEIPAGFEEQGHWQDGQFRAVWINDADLSTITYCEGDIIVMQYATQAAYDTAIVSAAEFYQAEKGGERVKKTIPEVKGANIDIFGQRGFMCLSRIPLDQRIDGQFYYDIRHSDDGFSPSTVECKVLVNHYGSLVMANQLNFNGLDYIPLTCSQAEAIIEAEEG